MPMSWDVFLAITIVHVHADVVQWIWPAKPSHKITTTTILKLEPLMLSK